VDTLQILKLLCAHIAYYFREKRDRQCSYIAILRRVRVTNVATEKVICTIYSECVFCNLRYPACNAHAPYFNIWPVQLYHTFPPYPINGTIFKWEIIEHEMCVLIFSEIFYETFLILRKIQLDIRNLHRSSCKVCYSCPIPMKLEFLSTEFREILKYQISWKSIYC